MRKRINYEGPPTRAQLKMIHLYRKEYGLTLSQLLRLTGIKYLKNAYYAEKALEYFRAQRMKQLFKPYNYERVNKIVVV